MTSDQLSVISEERVWGVGCGVWGVRILNFELFCFLSSLSNLALPQLSSPTPDSCTGGF
ncbi:hypothetical protein [Scytonema millei]|uniref:Uncharacterized protein n=1 Tax=Scytonema millei VB511283 TaxID=1245923 RepID=A0A9X5I5W9_9CYAN|nr:hypothetical protein [Scytonema millei]NHC36179.1 hypothetical protein [Scytonema millei VB511283]